MDNCLPGFACTNNLLWHIKAMIHEIHSQHRDTSFLWIHSYEVIKGNETVDQLARLVRHLEPLLIQLDPRNFFNTFKKLMFLEWQSWWEKLAKMKGKMLFAIPWHF
ncbi:hypothetical protein Trydic_g10494 [Trypoxylus dichotomus]